MVETATVYVEFGDDLGYRVGDDGSVWSRRPINGDNPLAPDWRPLKLTVHCQGYRQVSVLIGGRRVVRLVHHLVLEAFVGPRPPGTECCHNDGDRANNRLGNLRWDTRQSNMDDMERHGTRRKGDSSPRAALKAEDVLRIIEAHREGAGYKRIARRFGVAPATVYDIIKGRTWRHVGDGIPAVP